jgi:exopolysaccharide production protein ExoY
LGSFADVAQEIFHRTTDGNGLAPLLDLADSLSHSVDASANSSETGQSGTRSASWISPTRSWIDNVDVPAGASPRSRFGMPAAAETSSALGGKSKRIVDIIIASTALILLSPLLFIVSVLIFATLKKPIIYSHTRVGFGGRTFQCFKFRTMIRNADEVLRRHLASDPASAREWSQTQKLANDPRVTLLGHMLRKSSIDELPQLLNVLRGDMSCVGPRPVVTEELKNYGSSAAEYVKARPGMTGLWQVSGRNALAYHERVVLDCAYVRDWSLAGDIRILLKTIPAVARFEETA